MSTATGRSHMVVLLFYVSYVSILSPCDACKVHTWILHWITYISIIFASYKGYMIVFYWFWEIFHSFPIFLELTLLWEKTLFSIFLSFREPNDVQMTCKFKGIIFWMDEGVGAKEAKKWRPQGIGPRGHILWPRGTHPFGPRGSVAVDLSSRSFLLT